MSIRARWQALIQRDRDLLSNAGSWVGATAANSALGFLYWWMAARLFPPAAVGLASAGISAILLLGNIGMLGLGTLLLGELPQQRGREGGLILASLAIAGSAGLVMGTFFALAAPVIALDLAPFSASVQAVTLFAVGAGLTAISLVLDQALVGLLRGGLQLRRNILFAVTKLLGLIAVGLWWNRGLGLDLYATWIAGIIISLLAIATSLARGFLVSRPRPQWHLLKRLGRPALLHHALNLALMAPGLLAPLIVTAMLSAQLNASFYIAFMVAGLVFVVPNSLSMVLYTLSASDPRRLGAQLKSILALSFVVGLLANAATMGGAGVLLRIFGATYAQEAQWSLRFLALGVFPLTVKLSYVTVRRVENRIGVAASAMVGGAILEVAMLTLGTHWGGLAGLSLGWVGALSVEALVAAPMVVKVAKGELVLPPGRNV